MPVLERLSPRIVLHLCRLADELSAARAPASAGLALAADADGGDEADESSESPEPRGSPAMDTD
jgi:hypothetical protein